ncbi:MAG: hypothetical protein IPP72_01050 [Chitinophagaceae bacterium]|nr:hypothetical protein [Chitinophagaceae bacterium]
MAAITFQDARDYTTASEEWLKTLSDYIKNPLNPAPTNIYRSQKLAFEIDKADLDAVLQSDRVVGVLGYETGAESLTVILVGVDVDGRPVSTSEPRQTWPMLNTPNQLSTVLSTYLTPKDL